MLAHLLLIIPLSPSPDRSMRRFDTGKLKEVRKKLDSGQCRQDEIDEITKDLMEDCAEVGFARDLTLRIKI